MLRFGIPFNVWLDQPDGVIETALQLVKEQDETDGRAHFYDGADDIPGLQRGPDGWSG